MALKESWDTSPALLDSGRPHFNLLQNFRAEASRIPLVSLHFTNCQSLILARGLIDMVEASHKGEARYRWIDWLRY